ncbi:hypothetical protein QBC37DRAFT_389134 [Rhypophila decipiens]|uniref:Uncharacterized protein n=1 Tax=Rhypophila decipiens TaxID=261697 RepID=A0AAN6Y550_9PEZI|nr:hypothetical protein QBC37DRAFT_389134 [Rhypophila decipiens]
MARSKPSKRAIAGILPFLFALLAFTFSLLSVTSPEWASRDQYPDNTNAISQKAPIYTLFRSPFQICIGSPVPADDEPSSTTTNSTTSDEGDQDQPDNQPPPAPTNLIYTTTCTHYQLYGLNKTSCELPSTLGTNLATNVGDARQCQQIHLSGNYLVASAVFLGVSMLAILILFVTNLSDSLKYRSRPSPENGNGANHLKHIHDFPKILTILPTILNPLIIAGIITALIAQFYAIEGLIQSAPNNGDWTTSQGNREKHDPWVQGKALSTYLSLSWFWALLAGWSSWLLWGGYARRNVAAVMAGSESRMGDHDGHEGVKVK